MDFEFDKEIDALLRQTARSGGFVSNQTAAHLDADEISAFAENALPEKARQRSMAHLADCDKCRKSLSSLIALNSETENVEATHHAEGRNFIAVPVPWYRKLFAFPNLAYTMGALVLVFSGITVYTVLQSAGDSQNTMVSQTYDKQPSGKGMSSDGDQTASESYSSNSAVSANTMMSNAAMNSTSNSAANFSAIPSAPVITTNSNAAMSREPTDKDLKPATKVLTPQKEPVDLAKTEDSMAAGATLPAPKERDRENDFQIDGELQKQQNQAQNSIAQNQTQIMPDSRNVQRAPMPTMRAENKRESLEESKNDAAKKLKSAATTNVGGKSFKRESNVWYDSTYRGQTTQNITRGTNEYKKLDSGLRGIAENLGGTVVVVWKAKAYRIQ